MRERKKEQLAAKSGPKTVRAYLKEFQDKQAKFNFGPLYKKAASGDLVALDKLVASHSHLVRIIALKYQSMGIDMEELQYNGNIGLIKAIHRYTKSESGNFVTYAAWWIRQSIIKALREEAQLAHMPSISVNELWAVTDTFSLWEAIETDEPSTREMNQLLDCSVFELARLAQIQRSTTLRHVPRA